MDAGFEKALRAQIDQLEAQRSRLQSDLNRIDGQLLGMRQALTLYLGDAAAQSSEATEGHQPSKRIPRVLDPEKNPGWALVLQTCEQAPASGVEVDELEQRAEQAGYKFHRGTLLANLSNAARAGVIQRVSTGRYRRERADEQQKDPDDSDSEAPNDTSVPHRPLGASNGAGAWATPETT